MGRLAFSKSGARFRKVSGTTDLEKTIRKVFETLGNGGFAGVILGGFALQEYGYARYTDDVDVVVDHLEEAREYLSIRGFRPVTGNKFKLVDRDTKVEVELLPGGQSLGKGQLPLPVPTKVSKEPQFLTLRELIENKLSTYLAQPNRMKDGADVQELLKRNKCTRDFLRGSREDIVNKYEEIWDSLEEGSQE